MPPSVVQRSDLYVDRADRASELERLLAQSVSDSSNRHTIMQSPAERLQRLRALSRGRLRRDELDGALDRGEEGVAAAAFEQVPAEASVQQRGANESLSPTSSIACW